MTLFSLRKLLLLALLAQPLGATAPAMAQNLFAPAIKVNDKVITRFELNQRAQMLQLFRSPGNPATEARKQLIEDRLKLDMAETLDILPSEQELEEGMADFAARADMTTEVFLQSLAQAGIEPVTFRDFILSRIAWGRLVRAKFGPRVEVAEGDVDRALASTGVGNVRVLLSEIILPAPPAEAAQVRERAEQIAQITSQAAFAEAAQRFSASESSLRGGRLDWTALANLPAPLHPIILGLGQNQVSDPVPIDGGFALFQLRGLQEGTVVQPSFSAIDYATYFIPGGRTAQALAQAEAIKSQIDTCDDLYGIAKGQPEERLQRLSKAPGEIAADIGVELAKLDKHEVSTALTRGEGQQLVFLMLCGRTPTDTEGIDRNDVALSVQNRRLASFADGYLAQLLDEARIIDY